MFSLSLKCILLLELIIICSVSSFNFFGLVKQKKLEPIKIDPGRYMILSCVDGIPLDRPLGYNKFVPVLTLKSIAKAENKDERVIWTIESADKDFKEEIESKKNKKDDEKDKDDEEDEKDEKDKDDEEDEKDEKKDEMVNEREFTFYIRHDGGVWGNQNKNYIGKSWYTWPHIQLNLFNRRQRFIAYKNPEKDGEIFIKLFGGFYSNQYISVKGSLISRIRGRVNREKTPWRLHKIEDKDDKDDKEDKKDEKEEEKEEKEEKKEKEEEFKEEEEPKEENKEENQDINDSKNGSTNGNADNMNDPANNDEKKDNDKETPAAVATEENKTKKKNDYSN